MNNNNTLLIGGSGRSGTTILSRIFAQHPDICIAPEFRFLIDPDGIIDFYSTVFQSWSPYHFDFKVKRLEENIRTRCVLDMLNKKKKEKKRKRYLKRVDLNIKKNYCGFKWGFLL